MNAKESITQMLEFLRSAHQSCSTPDSWFYHGPADLLLREAEWFTQASVMPWEYSVVKACFRNAAAYALTHPGIRYVEGYAMFIIPCHHAWCVDRDNCVIEVTWKEIGSAYFGVQFSPKLVMRGSVLFNERNQRVYKQRRKPKRNLKGVISSC